LLIIGLKITGLKITDLTIAIWDWTASVHWVAIRLKLLSGWVKLGAIQGFSLSSNFKEDQGRMICANYG
jgi:hypothetical protein